MGEEPKKGQKEPKNQQRRNQKSAKEPAVKAIVICSECHDTVPAREIEQHFHKKMHNKVGFFFVYL